MSQARSAAPWLEKGARGVSGCLGLLLATAAGAQTVTSTADDGGAGTLRTVVGAAAAGATIDFALSTGVAPSIELSPELAVPIDLSLDGSGAPGLTLQSPGAVDYLRLDDDDMVVDDLSLRLIDTGLGSGNVLLDGTLTLTTQSDVTLSAQIQDVNSDDGDAIVNQLGSLVKEGSGTLTLETGNSYSGGTTIQAGTLQGTAQAIQGDISNGGTLIFDATNQAGSYDEVISDLDADNPGAVEKIGGNAVTFTAAQTYTGGTIIRAGSLFVDSTSAGSTGAFELESNVTVEADGTLELDLGSGAPGVHLGAWTSDGTLILDGEDEDAVLDLSLSDASLGGEIRVNKGTLAVKPTAIGAAITLRDADTAAMGDTPNGAVLRLFLGGTLPHAISGDGRVEIGAGSETVTLTGNNTYTGGTTITSGTLVVDSGSLPGDAVVESGTQLIFEQSANGAYAGTLSGLGDVEKRGGGTLTLSAAHGLTGSMRVSAGSLDLAATASLPGDLTVESGTVLMGAGSVLGSATLRGRVIPSGLTLSQASFESSSSLHFAVQEGQTPAKLNVAAGAVLTGLAGSEIDVEVLSGDYSGAGVDFVLIEGTGSVTNNFSLADDFAFVDVSFAANAAPNALLTVNVMGNVDQTALEMAATTPNQMAVVPALADLVAGAAPGSSAETVGNALFSVRNSEVGAVLDALGGEALSAFTSAHLATAQRFERGVHRRVRGLSWGSREAFFSGFGPSTAGEPEPPPEPSLTRPTLRLPSGILAAPPLRFEGVQPRAGLGAWSDAWGVLGSTDGDGNSHDTDANLAGVSLGVDARIAGHGRVGVVVGYTYADLDASGIELDANAYGVQTALYAGWSSPRAYLSGLARVAWARNESQREVRVGSERGRIDADFDSLDFGLGIELGANLARLGALVVQPVASFDWTRVERDAFRESGSGGLSALALRVEEESTDSLRSGLGLRATLRYPISENSMLVPELRARWLHEFGDEARRVRSRFRGSSTPLRVRGAEAARDTFIAGAGWAVSLGPNLRVEGDYDALVSTQSLAHELGVTLRGQF